VRQGGVTGLRGGAAPSLADTMVRSPNATAAITISALFRIISVSVRVELVNTSDIIASGELFVKRIIREASDTY
jgi:hypothetical protein